MVSGIPGAQQAGLPPKHDRNLSVLQINQRIRACDPVATSPMHAHSPAPDNLGALLITGKAWSQSTAAAVLSETDFDKALPADCHMQSLYLACTKLSYQIDSSSKAQQMKYANARNALRELTRCLASPAVYAPCDTPAASGGGVIAVDLDEAVHGLYTAISYTKNACANGFNTIVESLDSDAHMLANQPAQWLARSAMPHGGADLAIAAIVTVALAPLAALAVKAGWHEVREAVRHAKDLKQEVNRARTFLKTLGRIVAAFDPASRSTSPSREIRHLVAASHKLHTQRLHDLMAARWNNRSNGRIGAFSALSGCAIGAKALVDVSGKIAYAGVAGATALGGVSAILAPIAAIGAVGLGANMVIKSDRALKDFSILSDQLTGRLNTRIPTSAAALSTDVDRYLHFLPVKQKQRLGFLSDYAAKNRRFLAGSSLYALGAVTTFGLTAAALLGAGVLLTPFALGALLAIGVVGGLVMGRYSTQFLFGHDRLHRYEHYGIGDDPELDRHFLGAIEAFTDRDHTVSKMAGIRLRAAFYKQLSQREEQRQDFLGEVAEALKKRYHDQYSYSTDLPALRIKRGGDPTRRRTLQAGALKKMDGIAGWYHANGAYAMTLLRSASHAAAITAAHAARQRIKPYLSVSGLQHWLQQSENLPRVNRLMQDGLTEQIAYLQKKIELRLKMYVLSNNIPVAVPGVAKRSSLVLPSGSDAVQNVVAPDMAVLLSQLAKPLVRDYELLGEAESLLRDLTLHRSDSAGAGPASDVREAALSRVTARFLSLQEGTTFDALAPTPTTEQSQAALSRHYLKEASGRHRHLRGLLFDTELQVTKLVRRNSAVAAQRVQTGQSAITP
jgi:hypothetical protein